MIEIRLRRGLSLILGDVGTGKTTLSRKLFQMLKARVDKIPEEDFYLIGIEPYLLASSVNAFIAQRLVRQICPNCKEMAKEPLTEMRKINLGLPFELDADRRKTPEKDVMVYRGKGCEACRFTGFKGRQAIFEILVMEDPIRELIIKKASAADIKKKACELGMKTLRQQGWQKVVEGLTFPEEVVRVVQMEE